MIASLLQRATVRLLLGVLAAAGLTVAAAPAASGSTLTVTNAVTAELNCRAIAGEFRTSDLCAAVNTPEGQDFGQWWSRTKRNMRDFTSCEAASVWGATSGNLGLAKAGATFDKTSANRIGPSLYRVFATMTPNQGSIRLTTPTWPRMTKYQTSARAEMMRRLNLHEVGHLRVAAEVARVQSGEKVIGGTPTDVGRWVDRWVKDSRALFRAHAVGSDIDDGSPTNSYDEVTDHGNTQDKLGGLNTDLQLCDPNAAILGDVPSGVVGQPYTASLRLDRASPQDAELLITKPVTWIVAAGTLPAGTSLAADGSLQGSPTKGGSYTFTVRATDANEVTATREMLVTIVDTSAQQCSGPSAPAPTLASAPAPTLASAPAPTLASAPAPTLASVQPQITRTYIGSLGDSQRSSTAVDINDCGEVVGNSEVGSTTTQHAFVWLPSPAYGLPAGMTDLTVTHGITEAVAINNQGDILGHMLTSVRREAVLLRLHDGVVSYIPPLPAGATPDLMHMNNLGQVVGWPNGCDDAHCQNGFLWLPSPAYGMPAGIHDLGSLGTYQECNTSGVCREQSRSAATDINDQGQIVGTWLDSQTGPQRMFRWEAGTTTDLGHSGVLGRPRINEAGDIAYAIADSSGFCPCLGYLERQGQTVPLGTLGTNDAYPHDLNDAGDVTGRSAVPGQSHHAFLWRDHVMTDLGTLGGTYAIGFALNNQGQVAGDSAFSLVVPKRATVWTVTSPTT